MNTFPNSRTDDVAGAGHTRPLAHAIALRLLTAKGADAAGLKRFVASSGLAEAMVDVLEELTRRVRAMRVEFEDLAASARSPAPTVGPNVEPDPARAAVPQAIHPGY